MENRNLKIIGSTLWVLMALLAVFDAWLLVNSKFVNSEVELFLYVLLCSIFILFIIFRLLSAKIKELEKINDGIMHVLEKSEERRIDAEHIKNKIAMIIDDLPEGVLVINKNNEVAIINKSAEKFLGADRREVIKRQILELGGIPAVKKIISGLFLNYKIFHREEIKLDDNLILDLTVEPLALEKNNIARLVTMYDVTKIKNGETSKNQFLSLTAHQLKTPLSATRLSLKMMLDGEFGKITKQQKNILEKTYKNNESLIFLVGNLLKEARTGEPENSENKSPVDLENVALPVIAFYKDEIKRKKIDFWFKVPDGKLPEIMADGEKIKMVIQNLFDNAVKYTPPKGKIEAGITVRDNKLEFYIKDSGIGVPEDQKEKIFSRFSRATNAGESKTEGSGLGLSIAKEIVEKYHGRIWFTSKENEGSTFFFSLPFIDNQ